jgi:hypothetical protein
MLDLAGDMAPRLLIYPIASELTHEYQYLQRGRRQIFEGTMDFRRRHPGARYRMRWRSQHTSRA